MCAILREEDHLTVERCTAEREEGEGRSGFTQPPSRCLAAHRGHERALRFCTSAPPTSCPSCEIEIDSLTNHSGQEVTFDPRIMSDVAQLLVANSSLCKLHLLVSVFIHPRTSNTSKYLPTITSTQLHSARLRDETVLRNCCTTNDSTD